MILLKYELDTYIYISIRLTTEFDHDFIIFEIDKQNYIVDGFFATYMDDIMAHYERNYDFENIKESQGDRSSCFAEHLWNQQNFCGTHMK